MRDAIEPKKVLYLDLDGTIRKCHEDGIEFVNKPEDVCVYYGIKEKLKLYKDNGWRIVGITNQGGVALGHLSYKDMRDSIIETNRQTDNAFDRIMVCIHHPDAKDPEYANCLCRKPKIGNIVEAIISLGAQYQEYYPPHLALFVGDRDEDKKCAENAGIKFMSAKEWRTTNVTN